MARMDTGGHGGNGVGGGDRVFVGYPSPCQERGGGPSWLVPLLRELRQRTSMTVADHTVIIREIGGG